MSQVDREFTPYPDFIFPTYGEWRHSYTNLSGVRQPFYLSYWATMFSRISVLLGEPLKLDSHLDYDRPVRSALVLETMKLLDPEDRLGSIAYILSATEQGSLLGAEISRGIVKLSDWLEIPEEVLEQITDALKEKGFDQLPSDSAALVQSWQAVNPDQTLATWLRS